MISRCRTIVTLLLIGLSVFAGCRPTQPFFLHEDGDLSHLLQTATEIEYPDIEVEHNPEADQAHAPLTISNLDIAKYEELSLEQVVSITLQNSKVIRNLGGVTQRGFADALVGSTSNAATIYDAALTESAVGTRSEQLSPSLDGAVTAGQVGGTESALSQFDAQFEFLSGLGGTNAGFLSKTDRPQNITSSGINNQFFPATLDQTTSNVTAQLRKRSATGTTTIFRSTTAYDRGNSRGNSQALSSFWTQSLEIEVVQPLLRGSGTFINRIPVMLARMNSDITLASFEASVRNLILDVENTYWDLHCAYLNLETQRAAFDSAHKTWQVINTLTPQKETARAEAQAREQYYFFRSQMETALRQVLDTESRLRFLMGIAPTDGRVIRPVDEPSLARVTFDWEMIRSEALIRSPELRQQKWSIKQRELELASAKNQLLPRLDARAIYRWVGAGDNLINSNGNPTLGPQAPHSDAFSELLGGNYQEASVGFDFVPARIGARRELAAVRNAQLQLTRSKAQLEDLELNTMQLLSTAIRDLDFFYNNAQTHYNRFVAAEREVSTAVAQLRMRGPAARVDVNLVLQGQERRARAQFDYYTALCEYNKAIATVHFRKGSLLEYNNVCLAEGPWPKKAYWDAHERARERDASYYLDYGYTRPGVVSRGPISQHTGTAQPSETGDGENLPQPAAEVLPAPQPKSQDGEATPPPATGPVAQTRGTTSTRRSAISVLQTGAIGTGVAVTPQQRSTQVVPAAMSQPVKSGYDWGDIGLRKQPASPSSSASPTTSAASLPQSASADNPLRSGAPATSNSLR